MSTVAICVVAVCALLGWGSVMQAIEAVAKARAQAARCPCQDLDALTLATANGWVSKEAAGFEHAAREVH